MGLLSGGGALSDAGVDNGMVLRKWYLVACDRPLGAVRYKALL